MVDLRGYTLSTDGEPTTISDISYDPIYEAIKAGQNVVFQIHVNNLDVFMTVMGAGVQPGTGFMVMGMLDFSILFTNGSYHTTA